MLILKIAAATYAVGVMCLAVSAWRAGLPLTIQRRGRTRPHWPTWADFLCWPLWVGFGCLMLGCELMGLTADMVMRAVDRCGEHLMNPVFDFIDPPLEPMRDQRCEKETE